MQNTFYKAGNPLVRHLPFCFIPFRLHLALTPSAIFKAITYWSVALHRYIKSSSVKKLFEAAKLIAEEEEQRLKRQNHRFWVHTISKRRDEYSKFHHLFDDLFLSLTCLNSQVKFYELVDSLKFPVKHTKFHEVIDREERLSQTLK